VGTSSSKSTIKILVVDDHELIRVGIEKLIASEADMKVIASASSGEEAITKAKELLPDVVLLDINMPGLGGMEACRKILRYSEKSKIIVLSVMDAEPFPSKLLQLGARGYVSKDSSADELKDAIRTVHSKNQRYLSPKIAQQLALQHMDDKGETPFSCLSERELQVTQYIIKGDKAPDISEKLFLHSKTVNSYRYRIFAKLGIKTDVELTHLAIKYGLIKFEELAMSAESSDNNNLAVEKASAPTRRKKS
jgi:two-component system invasion response regulator UvrY